MVKKTNGKKRKQRTSTKKSKMPKEKTTPKDNKKILIRFQPPEQQMSDSHLPVTNLSLPTLFENPLMLTPDTNVLPLEQSSKIPLLQDMMYPPQQSMITEPPFCHRSIFKNIIDNITEHQENYLPIRKSIIFITKC